MKPIIEELLLKANAPFQENKDNEVAPIVSYDEMSYFPHLPKCRERQVYTADSAGKVSTCTKKSSHYCQGYSHYSVNMVWWLCLKNRSSVAELCGICYGFQVLRVCESPNIPIVWKICWRYVAISIFLLAYMNIQHSPKNCDLWQQLQYCLNREPNHFMSTWFLVDRFHWPNHTGKLICITLHVATYYVVIGCSMQWLLYGTISSVYKHQQLISWTVKLNSQENKTFCIVYECT